MHLSKNVFSSETNSSSNTKFKTFHIYSAVFFLFLTFITLREFLLGDFLFEHRDFIWPYDLMNFFYETVYTVNPVWINRSLLFSPFLSIFTALDLPSILAEKTFFILVRFFMGFFMYYVTYKFLTIKLGKNNKNTIFFISIFAGFFYSFNPFATTFNSADPIQAFSYSLIPLVFYFFDKALYKGSFLSIFLSSLTISLSIAAVPQYTILLPAFVLFPWLTISLIERKVTQRKIFSVIKNFFYVGIFSLLISLYWIIPTISSIYFGKVPQPSYVLTIDFLDVISSKTSLLDVFRLLGDWWPRVEISPIIDSFSWTIISFIIPFTIVTLILISRKSRLKYFLLAFFIILLVVMFFHKGAQEPFSDFYELLYNIPIIGWMFRVPTVMGQFLAFFVTLIISLEIYEILSRKISNYNLYLKYIPIFGIFLAISLISWPMFSGDLGGVITSQKMLEDDVNVLKQIQENDSKFFIFPREKSIYFDVPVLNPQRFQYLKYLENNIQEGKSFNYLLDPINSQFLIIHDSFEQPNLEKELEKQEFQLTNYTLFKNPNEISLIDVPKKNLLVFGGIEKFSSLASLDSFNTKDFSVVFSDYDINSVKKFDSGFDSLIVSDMNNMLVQLLDEDSTTVIPSDYTKRHKPEQVWSFGATHDPGHGGFHDRIKQFNIKNSDFDYKKGLIFTWAPDTINIPFEIKKEGYKEVFVRLMENQEGGLFELYIDNILIKKISTESQINKFVWKKIDVVNLAEGKHNLTLKNIDGLNAVNLITFNPLSKSNAIEEKINIILNDKRIINIFEGESDFFQKGKIIGYDIIGNITEAEKRINTTFTNKLKVPIATTHMGLEFWTEQNSNSSLSYEIKDISIKPVYDQYIFESNFNTQFDKWINYNYNFQNLSTIQNEETSMKNLKVDIKSREKINQKTVSTDFISVNEKTSIDYEVVFSVENVHNFNIKIRYYDKNQELIQSDWLSGLQSGTFNKKIEEVFRTPPNTSFIKLQFRTQANPEIDSLYIINSVKIGHTFHEIIPDEFFSNMRYYHEPVLIERGIIRLDIEKGMSEGWNKIESNHIPVRDNLILNYSISVESDKLGNAKFQVIYYNSSLEKIEDFNASNNEALILKPQSEVFTEFEVLKKSNYTIAAKVKKCITCSNLDIQIDGITKNFSIYDVEDHYQWVYLTLPLEKGKKQLFFKSYNNTALDTVVIYSESNENETLSDLFAVQEEQVSIKNYTKNNPTLFTVELASAPKKPFMMIFAEPYNSLWEATFEGKSYSPITLFSVTNGFWINEGDSTEIIIEYIPQKWFYFGVILTSITIGFSLIFITVLKFTNLKK